MFRERFGRDFAFEADDATSNACKGRIENEEE